MPEVIEQQQPDETIEDAIARILPPSGGLYAKLAKVLGEVGYVQKQGVNTFHKYRYVTAADLIAEIRGKLAAHGVFLIPSVEHISERQITTSQGKVSTITTARMTFTFCDGETGETHTAQWAGAGDDPADKGLYKAYTGALKYFLMDAFLIPTGDDPEADEGTDKRHAGAKETVEPKRGVVNTKTGEIVVKDYGKLADMFVSGLKAKKADLSASEYKRMREQAGTDENKLRELAGTLNDMLAKAGGNSDAVVVRWRELTGQVAQP